MRRFAIGSAVALSVGLGGAAAWAQTQQPTTEGQQPATQDQAAQDQQMQAADAGFVEWTDQDVFATQIFGVAVMAPDDQAADQAGTMQMDQIEGDQQFAIDSSDLVGFRNVGRVTDVLMSRTGEVRAVVIAQLADAPDAATGAAPGPGVDQMQVPPAAEMPIPGASPEVMVDLERLVFMSDATVPELIFAVLDMSVQEFQQGPVIDRIAMTGMVTDPAADPAAEPLHTPRTGWQHGWHAGRDMMMPPTVAQPGFAPVPVTEVSVDDLTGAALYGYNFEHIGSIGDVVLGPEGEASYVTVDIGGFLGIGAHEVAIGFDEITILQDANLAELQVHIAATREELENMPEYPG